MLLPADTIRILRPRATILALIEFPDGVAASLAMNGYGHFDIREMTWEIGEGGNKRS